MYANAWIQKLDVYFQLNPMVEEDALKMAILHLEREANDQWFHGIKTLGHDQISSYEQYGIALVEKFDRKYLELPFKELAQLKQIGTVEVYTNQNLKISQ